MKLLFSVKDQMHLFTVQEQLSQNDLLLLRQSMIRFFDSKPPYVVLDISQARIETTESELQILLSELKTIAQASNLSLVIAQTDIESLHAQSMVVASALQKKVDVLESRLKLQNDIKSSIEALKQENESLKTNLKQVPKPAKTQSKSAFSPLVERLWSEKE